MDPAQSGNKKVQIWRGIYWHNNHTEFHENRFTGSYLEGGTATST
jgi:hypothetical protein